MTETTSINVNEWRGHSFRGMLKMISKKWIAAGAIALLYLVWTAQPFGFTEAQSPPPPVPAMVAGPVGINGPTRSPSGDVVTSGERALLMVTNVGDEPITMRMTIRDATNFFRILATTQRTLQPGEGAS